VLGGCVFCATFEVITAVLLLEPVFLVTMPCRLVCMNQDFVGACGFHLQCSPGRLLLVISQKTVVFFRQVFCLGKTVKMLLYRNRISELVDALKRSKEQKMDIRRKYEPFSFSSITVNG
jgi:hypothetical protein